MTLIRARSLALAALLMLLGAVLLPQQAQARCALPQNQERYRIFVFGDKMATGLLAGLWRVLKNDDRFVARGRLREGSGLVRPRFHDWPRTIAGVLENQPLDIAIIMLGANDARDFRVAGRKLLFGSDAWKSEYASRVRQIMKMICDRNIALYWVGLPPVRDEGRNEALKFITDIIRAEARAAGVRFIDIYRAFATPEGGYAEEGPDVRGLVTRLRSRDGIHFIRPGNTKLARLVMDAVLKDVEAAKRLATTEEGGRTAGGKADRQDMAGLPLFATPRPDGGAEIVPAAELPDMDGIVLSAGMEGETADIAMRMYRLRSQVARGTPAARLFGEGWWPAPMPGRSDDFSLPEKPKP